mmetsp:Transcript_25102/g.87562  ORF Transcript_25102/g.87562 Transcript_25102/m.87562 type:complete len:602 (-) Transcript_25102:418-2223(-)
MFNKMKVVKATEKARHDAARAAAEAVAEAYEAGTAGLEAKGAPLQLTTTGARGAEVDPEVLEAVEARSLQMAASTMRMRMALAALGDPQMVAAAPMSPAKSAAGTPMSRTGSVGVNSDPLPMWPDPDLGWRHRVYLVFSEPGSSQMAKAFGLLILTVIIYSCVMFCVQSLEQFRLEFERYGTNPAIFRISEVVAIIIFSVEYIVRLFTVSGVPLDRNVRKLARRMSTFRPEQNAELLRAMDELTHRREPSHLAKMWTFVISPMNLVDLLAILPFYVEEIVGSGSSELAIVRILRLARVFRVFKLGKYHSGLNLIGRVLYTSADALYLLLFFTFLGMVLFGAIVFTLESGEYDPSTDRFLRWDKMGRDMEESPFHSIPATFWWVLVTSTTLGYGEMVPTSTAGKIVAAILMHAGILMLALPITVIGANFAVEYAEQTGDRAVASTVHQAVNIQALPQNRKRVKKNSPKNGAPPAGVTAGSSRGLRDSGAVRDTSTAGSSGEHDDDVGETDRIRTVRSTEELMTTAADDALEDARELDKHIRSLLKQTETLNEAVGALMRRLQVSRPVEGTAGEMPATERDPVSSSDIDIGTSEGRESAGTRA